ncbi:MAG TPA: peptide-methionine (S)-S-oxide reductase MsrA [Gemmatimonadaceae bacterium]|jgi:peptide-methionine (S)-S-oxide reductase
MKGYKALVAGVMLATSASPSFAAAVTKPAPAKAAEQSIVFAGGCFWGIQSVFEHTKGVTSAVSGYSGGSDKFSRPSYEQVSSGTTGHAESVKVTFDPSQVSLDQLMKVFFSVAHDPTQLNYQGPDHGTQYRSMVEYTNDVQKSEVTAFVSQLGKDRAWGGRPIVTQIVPLKTFFPAEAYHQHYAELHPNEPYIAYNDRPKVEALKKQFPQLYRDIK